MKKFEILEHKADLKIRVFGETKKGLFWNAVLGMESCLRPKVKSQKSKVKSIKIASPDLNALLVDFLSEVLYLIQTNREMYDKVKFTKFSDIQINAELSGKKTERFGQDIKAVTHHQLDIRQKNKGRWEATIIFDI
jgi:SHS2 domain-containing protein